MKNKHARTMGAVGKSQKIVEIEATDKFAAVKELAKPKEQKIITSISSGRICPQISCTISPEDKALLNELALYASNREKKILNTSTVIRALIHLGDENRDKLVF